MLNCVTIKDVTEKLIVVAAGRLEVAPELMEAPGGKVAEHEVNNWKANYGCRGKALVCS